MDDEEQFCAPTAARSGLRREASAFGTSMPRTPAGTDNECSGNASWYSNDAFLSAPNRDRGRDEEELGDGNFVVEEVAARALARAREERIVWFCKTRRRT